MLSLLDQKWETSTDIQDSIYDSLEGAENASLEVMAIIDAIVAEKNPNKASPL
jgi:hypothetical protein